MGKMPAQRPGRSKQNYGTPLAFFYAAQRRLNCEFVFDLAADEHNTLVPDHYFDEEANSLIQHWPRVVPKGAWAWLNPPYADIRPWAQKCVQASDRINIAMLVPAGIGANWYRDFVHGDALVLAVNGRLTFVGCTKPYPKDTILCVYGPEIAPGFSVWDWRKEP